MKKAAKSVSVIVMMICLMASFVWFRHAIRIGDREESGPRTDSMQDLEETLRAKPECVNQTPQFVATEISNGTVIRSTGDVTRGYQQWKVGVAELHKLMNYVDLAYPSATFHAVCGNHRYETPSRSIRFVTPPKLPANASLYDFTWLGPKVVGPTPWHPDALVTVQSRNKAWALHNKDNVEWPLSKPFKFYVGSIDSNSEQTPPDDYDRDIGQFCVAGKDADTLLGLPGQPSWVNVDSDEASYALWIEPMPAYDFCQRTL
jgi:hypothetical protein